MKQLLNDGINWIEKTVIAIRLPSEENDNSQAYQEAMLRMAELVKKGYSVGDNFTKDGEQIFILANGKA